MNAKEALQDIMEKTGVSLSTLAGRLSLTVATTWARVHEAKAGYSDLSVNKLVETAKGLDYKVVLLPREARVPEGGYVIEKVEQ